jgi:hypothetical protein
MEAWREFWFALSGVCIDELRAAVNAALRETPNKPPAWRF